MKRRCTICTPSLPSLSPRFLPVLLTCYSPDSESPLFRRPAHSNHRPLCSLLLLLWKLLSQTVIRFVLSPHSGLSSNVTPREEGPDYLSTSHPRLNCPLTLSPLTLLSVHVTQTHQCIFLCFSVCPCHGKEGFVRAQLVFVTVISQNSTWHRRGTQIFAEHVKKC